MFLLSTLCFVQLYHLAFLHYVTAGEKIFVPSDCLMFPLEQGINFQGKHTIKKNPAGVAGKYTYPSPVLYNRVGWRFPS
jgi:hypothetical protein